MTKNKLEKVPDLNSYLDYLDEVGFYNLNELKPLYDNFYTEMVDDHGLQVIILTGKGKQSLIAGNIIQGIESFNRAEHIVKLYGDSIKQDYIAFLYYEYAILYNIFGDRRGIKDCIKKGKQYAKSDMMIALTNYIEAMHNPDTYSMDVLIERVNVFKHMKKYSSYVVGLFRIGVAYEDKQDYGSAAKYFELALNNATEKNILFMIDQLHNAIGFLYILMNQMDKGIDYLLKHIMDVESHYTRVLMTENTAYAYFLKNDYKTSAEKFLEAYNIAKINHVVSQLPEECTFLGKCYNHLNEPQQALAYYKMAYDHAREQISDGFSYSGTRYDAMNAYVEYLETIAYRKFEDKPAENLFQFALGKPWKEIVSIFQYHFMMVHLRKTNIKDELFKQLKMKPSTFFSTKSRLKKLGFKLPNIKDKSKEFDSKYKTDALRLYIENNLINLSWKDAHKRFEKDVFRFLFQQYGFQRRKMENILQLSYPSVWAKLKEVGSDQQYMRIPMKQ